MGVWRSGCRAIFYNPTILMHTALLQCPAQTHPSQVKSLPAPAAPPGRAGGKPHPGGAAETAEFPPGRRKKHAALPQKTTAEYRNFTARNLKSRARRSPCPSLGPNWDFQGCPLSPFSCTLMYNYMWAGPREALGFELKAREDQEMGN